MIGIAFGKESATRYLDALISCRAVEPPAAGWTTDEMFALAGACASLCGVFARRLNASNHPEHLEADAIRALHDTLAGIEACEMLVSEISDDTYDKNYEPSLEANVGSVDGKTRIIAVKGFKAGWDQA